MENIYFANQGLLIGVIDHPFHLDSETFFNNEFKDNLFAKYKNNVANSFGGYQKKEYLDTPMYKPFQYNLFGNYNLAVLSLIDGYAFGNRSFHMGHGYRDNVNEPTNYRYQVLTGIGCNIDDTNYIARKAEETFLRTSDRYPFIGITRLTLNNGFLIGTGMELPQAIRLWTEELLHKSEKEHVNAFTIDSFGDSEIILITFSDSLIKINEIVSEVKKIQACHLSRTNFNPDNCLLAAIKEKNLDSFHIFSGSYTHLGYDVNWQKSNFLPIKDDKDIKIGYRWELKPGHQKALKEILKNNPLEKDPSLETHLTGSNAFYTKEDFDLKQYCIRLNYCRTNLYQDIISLRVHLFFVNSVEYSTRAPHPLPTLDIRHLLFKDDEMKELRNHLSQCGTAKLTRERVMKMFARYNQYIRNPQTYIYFIELRDFLLGLMSTIKNYASDNNIAIEDIDNYLNAAIIAFEGAFFNRFYQSVRVGGLSDFALEHNGGIQQYVTSFTLIFKESLKVLSNNKEINPIKAFLYVSGYESVVSQREIMRINMNLITYPELFALSIYKEAGNFIIERIRTTEEKPRSAYQRNIQMWYDIIYLKRMPDNLRTLIIHSSIYRPECPAHRKLAGSLNTELLSYFIADVHNFYFGFNCDFELLYHFYWKYFLQLSTSYNRNGELRSEHFITYLLRLFIIQFYMYSDTEQAKEKIKERMNSPFDPKLSSLWKTHFLRVLEITEIIWEGLKKERFNTFLEEELLQKISNIALDECYSYTYIDQQYQKEYREHLTCQEWYQLGAEIPSITHPNPIDHIGNIELISFWKEIRTLRIRQMTEQFQRFELIQPKSNEIFPEMFVSDMLIAYLKAIYQLDNSDKNKVIKSLSRNIDGNTYTGHLDGYFSPLLSDPQGGIFTHGLNERQTYFGYRTTLYKSLWNYSTRKKDELLKLIQNE